MRVLEELEMKVKLFFQVRHLVGVDNNLSGLIARCKLNMINVELKRRVGDRVLISASS